MRKKKDNIIVLKKVKSRKKRRTGIRKLLILLPLAAAILLYGFLFMEEEAGKIGTHIITAQNAYLLEKPEIHGEVLKMVPMNTSFSSYGKDGAYYKVKYEDTTGYLSQDYFILIRKNQEGYEGLYRESGYASWTEKDGQKTQDSYFLKRGKPYTLVAAADTNFRSGSDIRSDILHTIPKGDDILFLDGGIQWYRVFHAGQVGYIHRSTFIEKKTDDKKEP